MKRLWPTTFLLIPVILLVVAKPSYAYNLPGDAPTDDNRFALSSLKLALDDSVASSIAREGDNAATMKHEVRLADGLSFSSSYSNRSNNLYDAFGAPEADGFWDLSLRTPRSGVIPALMVDLSYGGFDAHGAGFDPGYYNPAAAGSGGGLGDDEQRMLKIKTDGKLGLLEHGFSYKNVGINYYDLGNKQKTIRDTKNRVLESTEAWVGKSFGDLSISQFMRQSASDGGLREESLTGGRLEYTWSYWPYVGTSFSQASGTLQSEALNTGHNAFQVGISAVTGSLSVAHDKWNADVYIDRTSIDEATDQSFGQPDLTTYYLGGSIYPDNRLTLLPAVSYIEEDYREYSAQTRMLSTSLSLTYQPAQKNYSFTAYASNDTLENRDWAMDTHYFYSEAGVEWELSGQGGTRNLLALTFGYDRYEDSIYSGSNMEDYSVKLTFKSYTLGSILKNFKRLGDSTSASKSDLSRPAFYGSRSHFP